MPLGKFHGSQKSEENPKYPKKNPETPKDQGNPKEIPRIKRIPKIIPKIQGIPKNIPKSKESKKNPKYPKNSQKSHESQKKNPRKILKIHKMGTYFGRTIGCSCPAFISRPVSESETNLTIHAGVVSMCLLMRNPLIFISVLKLKVPILQITEIVHERVRSLWAEMEQSLLLSENRHRTQEVPQPP